MMPLKFEEDTLLQLVNRLFQESPDQISIVGKDYRYVLVNKSYEIHHGCPKNKIIGKHIVDLLGKVPFQKIVKPYLDKCLLGEKVSYQAWFHFKNSGRRFMFVSYFPLPSDGGEIERIAVVARDITDVEVLETTIKSIQEMVGANPSTFFSQKASFMPGLKQKEKKNPIFAKFSLREKRVLAMLAEGKTNKEIATDLGLSDKTVRNLLTGMYKTLQVTRRTEAVAIFARRTF